MRTRSGAPQSSRNQTHSASWPSVSAPLDLPFGAGAEVALEALVGVEAEQPVGPVGPGRLRQRPVVDAVLELGLGTGLEPQQLEHAGLLGDPFARPVGRAVVERDDPVDVRAHVREEARQESHLVAKGDERDQAPAAPAAEGPRHGASLGSRSRFPVETDRRVD